MTDKTIVNVAMIFALLLTTIPAATAVTFSIGNGTAAPDGTVVVPVMLNDVTDAGALEIDLLYDPSVVIGISSINSDFEFPPMDPPPHVETGRYMIKTCQIFDGLSGDVKVCDVVLEARGSQHQSSPLNLTVLALQYYNMTDIPVDGVINGTFVITEAPDGTPVMTDPGATPPIIPDDTDNDPKWGETSQLNITVTDDDGIAGVTIDLSQIGGSPAQAMDHIGGNIWSVATSAPAGTPPETYDLQVTATDTEGKSSRANISLRIVMNGDVSANDAVNIADAMLLANYASYPGQYTIISETVADVTGNGAVNIADAMLLANYVSYPGQYTLR
jgi:hypothetical protein